jgi:hypothetical protein
MFQNHGRGNTFVTLTSSFLVSKNMAKQHENGTTISTGSRTSQICYPCLQERNATRAVVYVLSSFTSLNGVPFV